MIKHCNTIKLKLKYNGETNEINDYLNGSFTYTDRHIRTLPNGLDEIAGRIYDPS